MTKQKIYYFPNPGCEDAIFGGGDTVCIDYAEIVRLAAEWETTADALLEQLHEATEDDISAYGTYDMPIGRYSFAELKAAACRHESSTVERLALLDWLNAYDADAWNGWRFDLGDGRGLSPITRELPDGDIIVVDAEVM